MSTARKVLLFVLDHEELRSHFNQSLARTSHATFFAFDGADGFDRFLEGRPDICFVCEGTSRISGSILCQLIREHRLGRGVGVYLLSAHADDKDLQARASNQGIDGVLATPPDEATLHAILDGEHAFLGELDDEDAEADGLTGDTPPPRAEPVVVDADGVFAGHEEQAPTDAVTLQLRAPSSGTEDPATAGIIELTPSMQKRPSPDATRKETPPGDVATGKPSQELPEALPLGTTATAATEDEDHPPFSGPSDGPSGADADLLAAAAQALMGKPPIADPDVTRETGPEIPATGSRLIEEPIPEGQTPSAEQVPQPVQVPADDPHAASPGIPDGVLSPADDTTPAADTPVASILAASGATIEEPTPVGMQPALEEPGPEISATQEPVQEEPTPVGEVDAAVRAMASEDLIVAEEPTPVEQRPEVDIDEAVAAQTAADGDVFASPASEGTSGGEVSGIFPLAPEERDSHTIRQAISESQLGGRLTRRILALYRLLDSIDYYQLLGVTADADVETVQRAFHGLALEYHPDRFFPLGPGFIKERVDALFMRICEAYTVLSNRERRGGYDALLAQRAGGPVPRYPLGEVQTDQGEREVEAITPVGRKYMRLAFAALARGDVDAAHLNMTFAIGHEPDNATLRNHLSEIEQHMQDLR